MPKPAPPDTEVPPPPPNMPPPTNDLPPPPPALEGVSTGGLQLDVLPPTPPATNGTNGTLPPVPTNDHATPIDASSGSPAGLPPIPTNDDDAPEDTEDPTYNLLNLDIDGGDFSRVEQAGKVFHAFAHKNVKAFKDIVSQDEERRQLLRPELLKAIDQKGFIFPSRIQADALPIILNDPPVNLIGQAHHGSGKTITFCLSMISRSDETRGTPSAVCIVHTRELANQIQTVCDELTRFTSLKTYVCVSQARLPRQITQQIVIGTPGKLNEALRKRCFDPQYVKVLVVDEADELLKPSQSRSSMLSQITQIKKHLPADHQTLLFSATFPKTVREYALRMAPNPYKITIKRKELTLEGIHQYEVVCNDLQDRFNVLSTIYGLADLGQLIIFVQTVHTAQVLYQQLRAAGYTIGVIYGRGMPVHLRDQVMENFRKGETTVLISTNLLARGIDVLAVTMVVNYDIPTDKYKRAAPETYIHRIGRSGRWGGRGIALNFVERSGKSQETLQQIADYFKIRTKSACDRGLDQGYIADMPQIDGSNIETLTRTVSEYLTPMMNQ